MSHFREIQADLHIHSCLSPCASLDLSPRKIVEAAKTQGLDVIAVTDHNSAGNVRAVMRLGEKAGLTVLPGLEVQSREEIHFLTLFPDWAKAADWADDVKRQLPEIPNDPAAFGDQPIVDEEGEILAFEPRLLLNSLFLSAEEILSRVARKGGLAVPAHFDRASFSLISQLGFIPAEMRLKALEISGAGKGYPCGTWGDGSRTLPLIAGSDAHGPEEIGSGRTVFFAAEPALGELCLALENRGGRRIAKLVRASREFFPCSPL